MLDRKGYFFEPKSSGGSGGGGGADPLEVFHPKNSIVPSVVDDQTQWIQEWN